MLTEANDMVEQKRWDIAANRYYYACYHILQGLFSRMAFLQRVTMVP